MQHERIEERIERLERLERRYGCARRTWGRRRVTGLAVVGLLVAAGLPMVAHTYPDAPYMFAPGDPISADEMNESFAHMVEGITALEGRVVPVGSVVAWAGSPAMVPSGWLPCDGAEYSTMAYPELAMAIGSVHGGDGATVFHVPDLRGRFLRGVDEGTGRDPDAGDRVQPQEGSGNAGDGVGSVQDDEFRSHAHGTAINFPNNTPGSGAFGTGTHGVFGDVMIGVSVGTVNAQRSSAEGGAETRPVNVAMHFIIRAE